MVERRRRAVLRAGAAAIGLSTVGARATASGSVDAGYAPAGELDVEGAAELVLAPDGETAFVAVGGGFVCVDLSKPKTPEVVGERADLVDPEGTPVREVLDVKYDDGQLLVPTAAQGGGPRGFYLFDVRDPTDPMQVGEWFPTPAHGNHNGFLLDGVAYLTAGLQVVVVDVSGDSFERLATWEPGDWNEDWANPPNMVLHDLYVQGDYAYCAYWDAGTFILDVSDPANPSFVVRVGDYSLEEMSTLSQQAYLEPEGNDHYVTVNDDATLMGVGGESWDLDPADDESGGPSGVTLYDVSTTAEPERVGHVDPPMSRNNAYRGGTWTTSHNFDLVGDRLYASWYQGGVSVHDVSDPAEPERLSWWAAPAERAFWTAQLAVEGEFFVASSHAVNGTTGGVLTFPDASGEMAEAPSSVAWSAAALPSTTTTTTAEQTTTRATTSTEPPTTAPPSTTDEEDADSTPGFGVLAALAGLGVGAARYRRGEDGGEDA